MYDCIAEYIKDVGISLRVDNYGAVFNRCLEELCPFLGGRLF